MSGMTATNGAKPAESFLWTFPGAPLRIEIPLNVVEGLKRQVLAAGAAETGGILLGHTAPDAPGEVRITGFHRFPAPHGELFRLNERERREFAAIVAEVNKAGPAMAVGYYRSHHREGLCLDEHDLLLADGCLASPTGIALIMRPEAGAEVTAGFFFRDEGHMNAEFSFMEFPLDSRELREWPAGASARRRPRLRAKLVWGAIASGVVAVAWVAWGFMAPGLAHEAPARGPAMSLRAEVRGPELRVTWDRSAAVIRTARVGLLSIRDGGGERSISLAADQLRSGALMYTPQTRTVQFRMEVFDHQGHVAMEHLLVLDRGAGQSRPLR